MAAITALFGRGDVIFSDELNHSSIIDGIRLSGAKVIIYPHLDYSKLEQLLKKYRSRYNFAGVISDGVFSAHGTYADLDKIHELKQKYSCVSMIDDTHGFAVIGRNGRGLVDFFKHKPDLLTASLAKGLAGFGGMIAGQVPLMKVIDCLGRQNTNTSHLSPILAAQGLYQLRHYRENLRSFQSDLYKKMDVFNSELRFGGINPYESFLHPIFSFTHADGQVVLQAVQELFEIGVVPALFPPPVAPTPTIRFSLHRELSNERLRQAAIVLRKFKMVPVRSAFTAKLTLESTAIWSGSNILPMNAFRSHDLRRDGITQNHDLSACRSRTPGDLEPHVEGGRI